MKRRTWVALAVVTGSILIVGAFLHLHSEALHGHFSGLHHGAGMHASGPAAELLGGAGGDPAANARAREGVAEIGRRWDDDAFARTVALYTEVHRGIDWPGVLAVATENAKKTGVEKQHTLRPGDAFKVDYGTGYDVALVTNFLHHYDIPTCTTLMRKIAAATRPGGRVAILEFVPNDDRVTPPSAAAFSLQMLAGTPAGDAYTLAELRKVCEDGGWKNVTAHPTPTMQTIVVATRA